MRCEEVEVTIDPEGKVQLMVKGMKGKSCLAVTKSLEEAMGAEIESRTYTSEYYETASVSQVLPQSQKTR